MSCLTSLFMKNLTFVLYIICLKRASPTGQEFSSDENCCEQDKHNPWRLSLPQDGSFSRREQLTHICKTGWLHFWVWLFKSILEFPSSDRAQSSGWVLWPWWYSVWHVCRSWSICNSCSKERMHCLWEWFESSSYEALLKNAKLNHVEDKIHAFNMDGRDFVRKIVQLSLASSSSSSSSTEQSLHKNGSKNLTPFTRVVMNLVITRFLENVMTTSFRAAQAVILVQFTRGKLACSDGVRQAPGSIGICYSKTNQRDEREYAVTWLQQ